jgi:hypothetical protein
MSGATRYSVYVSIHKSDPVDFAKFRHVGLWFTPHDGSAHYFFHVTGSTNEFTYERRKNYNPTTTRTFAKLATVGNTTHSMTPSQLTALMASVHVTNHDPEFNCHQWVQYALKKLLDHRYISKEAYDQGLDGMLNAILEAGDDQYAY